MAASWKQIERLDTFNKFGAALAESHAAAGLAAGLPDIAEVEHAEKGREFVLLAAGPSLDGEWETVRQLAAAGAVVVACERMAAEATRQLGRPPEYVLAVDGSPDVAGSLEGGPAGSTYLLALQCSPEAFEAVQGRRAFCFLVAQPDPEGVQRTRELADRETALLNTGPTVAIALFTVGILLGGRDFDLFGFDCHLGDGDVYAKGVTGVGGENHAMLARMPAGRIMRTSPSFLAFARDMGGMETWARELGMVDRLTVHGDSLFNLVNPRRLVAAKLASGEYAKVDTVCLCGDAGPNIPVANLDRDGFDHPMAMCEACGLIRATARLDDAALEDFYRNYYRALYGPGAAPAFACEMGFDLAALAELLHFSLDRVFEVGAGSGEFLLTLPPGEMRVGYEPDEVAARKARDLGVDVRSEPLDFGSIGMSLVAFHHSLEHMTDPAAELRRARGLLAPGGVIYVGLPGLHRHEKRMLWQLAHLWQFEAKTLRAFMEREGFESIYIDEGICSLWRPV